MVLELTYRKFTHKETNQTICIPAGRYGNFLNTIRKLTNYVKHNISKYYVCHLTLTIADADTELEVKDLHRVMQFISNRLDKAGSDFKYVAVKEIQTERLEKYGDEVIHYHVLCVYSKAYAFPSAAEVAKSWRLGFVKIKAPKLRMKPQKVINYLGKYIGKGYDYESLNVRKSFSASQIKQVYKLQPKRLALLLIYYPISLVEKFKSTFTRVSYNGDVVKVFRSDWFYDGMICEATPF